ncbi:AzlC family ABC transporter permease [Cellulosilyticum sp. I15G10I2]|uniref:AzlC family ABC transporter permease n=1 Tax=Cellulosilyticum sp. I15G10I2 TaxID=1892843 RepID=UPI00085CADDF|nr:AzlC family ABC transporter permease [Cellulosilyticum sp. I15G10I2]
MISKNSSMFLGGAKKGIPILIGFIPISTAFAVIALQAKLTPLEVVLMSIMLLAGASQLMAVNMLAIGAGSIEIIIATFIINMRHLIMSIYVMNRLKEIPRPLKLILAFGVTDETFGIMSMEDEEHCNQYFFSGLAAVTYGAWIGGTILGIVVNNVIPTHICSSMSIALYAMFIGLLMPNMHKNHKVAYVVGISIALNIIFSLILTPSWAVVFATLFGGVIGSKLLGREEKNEHKNINSINDFGDVNSNIHS